MYGYGQLGVYIPMRVKGLKESPGPSLLSPPELILVMVEEEWLWIRDGDVSFRGEGGPQDQHPWGFAWTGLHEYLLA